MSFRRGSEASLTELPQEATLRLIAECKTHTSVQALCHNAYLGIPIKLRNALSRKFSTTIFRLALDTHIFEHHDHCPLWSDGLPHQGIHHYPFTSAIAPNYECACTPYTDTSYSNFPSLHISCATLHYHLSLGQAYATTIALSAVVKAILASTSNNSSHQCQCSVPRRYIKGIRPPMHLIWPRTQLFVKLQPS